MPHQWHSRVTNSQRRITWHAVLDGSAQVVVGARSALFLPWAHLGLLVVDEEHESAFKQEEGVIYHGRDMAVARAHLGRIPIILASATPSLETVINVREKRYQHVCLRERYGPATLPQIDVIDLRTHRPEPIGPANSWISLPSLPR